MQRNWSEVHLVTGEPLSFLSKYSLLHLPSHKSSSQKTHLILQFDYTFICSSLCLDTRCSTLTLIPH
ncbi:hypothetical protein GDO81_029600 [Engystomops pustulosus]|uniref:Uncharacterized protein n=1 Tax=Engystomops pustulosus TaxID=76066 RepID=A0AAV6ZHQ2_ENGPU|nr:hypothetical protein GDO81_029600 [Engystomops pustulosus]